MCLLVNSMCSLKKMPIQVLYAFCNWVVCFFHIELYEFFIYFGLLNPLLGMSFADFFSHSVDCLFITLMVSFALEKLVNLIRSHLGFD